MKLGQIVNGGMVLRKIAFQDLPLKQAYKISMLIDKVNPQLAFFDQQRSKVEGNEKEFEELLDMEVDFSCEPIEVALSEDIRLSPLDIEVIKPFIKFVEE